MKYKVAFIPLVLFVFSALSVHAECGDIVYMDGRVFTKTTVKSQFATEKMIAGCKTKTANRFKEEYPFVQIKNWRDVHFITHRSFFDEKVEGTLHFIGIVGNVDVYNKKLKKDAYITVIYRVFGGEREGVAGINEEVFLYELQFPEDKDCFEKGKSALIEAIDEGFFVSKARDLLTDALKFRDSFYK